MRNFKLTLSLLAAILGVPLHSAFAQTAMTQTTLAAAVTSTSANTVSLASATNVAANGFLYVDGELMSITGSYVSGATIVPVLRGASPALTAATKHLSGATVYVVAPGDQARSGFIDYPLRGTCTAANQAVLPRINTSTGNIYDCKNGLWGRVFTQYVPPTQCTFAPTTLTTTNTYPQIGASTVFVLNGTSNAAAGTNTLTCDIMPPSSFLSTRGSVLYDIVVAIGSQTTAPTSLGTATLGSITLPTPSATTQTASTVTPVTIGGTVTTVGPTTTVQTVTTAGAFLTFKHTFSTPVVLGTDLQVLRYTFPFLQSAAAAMTLNTPGLWVHYLVVEN